jgi:deazaflavin-dependent oxidoreductase (nitroreductase family)
VSKEIDAQTADKLRKIFRQMNKFMLLMWRLGMGKWFGMWPEGWGQIMVITHKGRVTGKEHRTPVNFAIVNGEVYCTAGFGKIADWYKNILADPKVEIWLPESWWDGTAKDVTGSEYHLEIMRAVIKASGFAGPLFGVDPRVLDDEALEKITRSYKLIHIQRESPRTGPGGPGEMAWVWQIATFVLLPLVFLRGKRKK